MFDAASNFIAMIVEEVHKAPAWLAIFVIFALILGVILFRRIRYGSFAAAQFGAPITQTSGEITIQQGIARHLLRIHALGPHGGVQRSVGIEMRTTMLMSVEANPLVLSIAPARELAHLLQRAAGDK